MKLVFDFSTDGDFYLDRTQLDSWLDRTSYNFKKEYEYSKCGYDFRVEFEVVLTKEDEDDTLYKNMIARDFTEHLIKSIRFHHMFLMRDLYNLYEEILHWLFHKPEEKEFTTYWSGNYDDTEITIIR